MKFCERLKAAREYAGLTQQQLIDKMGINSEGKPLMSQANLAKMELNQKAKGSIHTVFIAKACGVNAEWLANEVGNMVYDNKNNNQTAEGQVLAAMQQMDEKTKYQVVKISNSLIEPTAYRTTQ